MKNAIEASAVRCSVPRGRKLGPTIAVVLAAVAALVVPIAGQAPGAPVVEKASQYVADFVRRFSRVVAEECYV